MKVPLANGKYSKPARLGAEFLCFSGVAIWLFHFYVFYQYDATRPTRPDVTSGRVYAQNNHNRVVYLNKAEDFRIFMLRTSAFCLFIAGIAVGYLFVNEWNRKPQPWEKKQW
jgi:hypothetical protein